jgi:hypothetical protein
MISLLVIATLVFSAGAHAQQPSPGGPSGLTPDETRQIAKDAFIYGFPLVTNYQTYGDDGSLTLYVQKTPPGAAKEANWLPAPDGIFYSILRIYMPAPEVVNGGWKKPPMQPVTAK